MSLSFEPWALVRWFIFFSKGVAWVKIFCCYFFFHFAPIPDVLVCRTTVSQTLTHVVLLAVSSMICAICIKKMAVTIPATWLVQHGAFLIFIGCSCCLSKIWTEQVISALSTMSYISVRCFSKSSFQFEGDNSIWFSILFFFFCHFQISLV